MKRPSVKLGTLVRDIPRPPVDPEFKPTKPRKGQWLVALDREKVYGRVLYVRGNRTFVWEGTCNVRVESSWHWDAIQTDLWGRMRFVDEIPEGFTREGNGWRSPLNEGLEE